MADQDLKSWYYLDGEGEVRGPVAWEPLTEMHSGGGLGAESLVCPEGDDVWMTYDQALASRGPEAPGNSVVTPGGQLGDDPSPAQDSHGEPDTAISLIDCEGVAYLAAGMKGRVSRILRWIRNLWLLRHLASRVCGLWHGLRGSAFPDSEGHRGITCIGFGGRRVLAFLADAPLAVLIAFGTTWVANHVIEPGYLGGVLLALSAPAAFRTYFYLAERPPMAASFGKMLFGLRVVAEGEGAVGRSASAIRAACVAFPLAAVLLVSLAHPGLRDFITDADQRSHYLPLALLYIAYFAPSLFTGGNRAPHDLLSGTRVVRHGVALPRPPEKLRISSTAILAAIAISAGLAILLVATWQGDGDRRGKVSSPVPADEGSRRYQPNAGDRELFERFGEIYGVTETIGRRRGLNELEIILASTEAMEWRGASPHLSRAVGEILSIESGEPPESRNRKMESFMEILSSY